MSDTTTNPPWLAILGVNEDGVLSPDARRLIGDAALVVGGARHLALADALIAGERMAWSSPLAASFDAIMARRPQPVVVLASGDPFCYGVGSTLASLVPAAERLCIPAPSSLALACARLGWTMQDCATISFCGRPLAPLAPLLQPGARILALSADAGTPGLVATLLQARGFGPSVLHVMEALSSPQERIRSTTAAWFRLADIHPLNLLAIEVSALPGAQCIPLSTGLPDALFEHDGQITKREIRAVTLSALAPRRGERLWDIGAGSGAIAIEWLLRHPANQAVAIERHGERAARAARNAVSLGVPHLHVAGAPAPGALAGLPPPDAVFIGGGAHEPGVIDAAWAALSPYGRLVANAVTVESEAALIAARARFGGTLSRLSVERLDRIGGLHGYRPAITVTQWLAEKA